MYIDGNAEVTIACDTMHCTPYRPGFKEVSSTH